MTELERDILLFAKTEYQKEIKDLSAQELHNVVSNAVMAHISSDWAKSEQMLLFIIDLNCWLLCLSLFISNTFKLGMLSIIDRTSL